MSEKPFWNAQQIADKLGFKRSTIMKYALRDQIPSYKCGRSRLFRINEVRAAMERIKKDANPPHLIDSFEAAKFLHMHYKTVQRLALTNRVPGRKIKGKWFFDKSELATLVKEESI